MALSFNYSQNIGRNIEAYWLGMTLSFIGYAREYGDAEKFKAAIKEDNVLKAYDIFSFESFYQVFVHALESIFQWVSIEEADEPTRYNYPEFIEITDSVFEMLPLLTAEQREKLNNTFEELGMTVSEDFHLLNNDDDNLNEDLDGFYYASVLLKQFKGNTLSFYLYDTEELDAVVYYLCRIKQMLLVFKEASYEH